MTALTCTRLLALTVLALVIISFACGDDDGGQSPASTETPVATTAVPTKTPEPTVTEAPTATPIPTPVNTLTDEIIAAAGTYLATSADPVYDLTDPAECSDITELIDAGEATIEDFIGENLVCLAGAEFGDGVVRAGFGPYASEVIGVLVLEETQDGGWVGTAIEPAPSPEA